MVTAVPCPALPCPPVHCPDRAPHPCQGHLQPPQPGFKATANFLSLLFDSLPSGKWTQTHQLLSAHQVPAGDVPLVVTSHPLSAITLSFRELPLSLELKGQDPGSCWLPPDGALPRLYPQLLLSHDPQF